MLICRGLLSCFGEKKGGEGREGKGMQPYTFNIGVYNKPAKNLAVKLCIKCFFQNSLEVAYIMNLIKCNIVLFIVINDNAILKFLCHNSLNIYIPEYILPSSNVPPLSWYLWPRPLSPPCKVPEYFCYLYVCISCNKFPSHLPSGWWWRMLCLQMYMQW